MKFLSNITVKNSRYVLLFGFGTSLCLFALLIGIGLTNLRATQANIQSLIDNSTLKTDLITKMHNMARERSLALFSMASIEDPFERDEVYENFLVYGGVFSEARGELRQMKLSTAEQALLVEQGHFSGMAVPIQNEIIALLRSGNMEEAKIRLRKYALPAQENVLNTLSKLRSMQLNATKETIATINQSQQAAMYLILSLGSIAFIVGVVIALRVTKHISATESTLFIEKDLAESTLYSIGDGVITTDQQGQVRSLNPVAEKLTGWKSIEAVGKKIDEIFHLINGETKVRLQSPVDEVLEKREIVQSSRHNVLIRRDNTHLSIELTTAPILDSTAKIYGAIVVFRDVTQMFELANQLNYEATHDHLTGLLNRREFELRLGQLLEHARLEHTQHALLYLDLDQFKVINDTCGHLAGDELLKQLSWKLKSALRKSDILARLGGDEFGVLLDSCTLEKASSIAQLLHQKILESKFIWNEKGFDVGASIGLVPITASSGVMSDILSAADSACYEAKDQGRNRIHIYHPGDQNLVKRRGEMQWVHRIRRAIENKDLILYYQDIMPLTKQHESERICEILVRLRDHNNKLIPPMAFIPAAERYDIMVLLDQQVVEQSFQFLTQQSTENDIALVLSINISGQSLCEDQFLNFIMQKMYENAISGEQIIFEITETAAVRNLSRAIEFINTLKTRGCRFALDDFGSGLSSFSYLKNLPVDFLKIDGSFVRDIVDDPTDLVFVESIHQIGHVMGIKTIAEYVENLAILEKLTQIGVDYAQGFAIGKPRDIDEFAVTLPTLCQRDVG